MNQTIYKYPVPIENRFSLMLPKGAEIICVKGPSQRMGTNIYAIIYTDRVETQRHFELFSTGEVMSTDTTVQRKYIGTFNDGNFVGHLFERININ